MEKRYKNQIRQLLMQLDIVDAIDIIESIGKEFRKKNSIRINALRHARLKDFERPDLETLKSK